MPSHTMTLQMFDETATLESLTERFSNTTEDLSQALNDFVNGNYGLDFQGGPELQHVLATGFMIIGIILIYLGCRLFKPTLFTLTFIGVSGLAYFIGMHENYNQKAVFGVALALGFIAAFLAIKLFKLALFGIGVFVGFIVWLTIKSIWPTMLANPTTSYAALAIMCLTLGIFSLYLEKYWLLIATPILGTFLFWQGLDHWANLDLNVFGTIAGNDQCTSSNCYYYYAGMIAMTLSGIFVQYRWTGKFSERPQQVHVQKVVYMPTPMKEVKTANYSV